MEAEVAMAGVSVSGQDVLEAASHMDYSCLEEQEDEAEDAMQVRTIVCKFTVVAHSQCFGAFLSSREPYQGLFTRVIWSFDNFFCRSALPSCAQKLIPLESIWGLQFGGR